jgi:hypothetical protein
MKFIPMANGKSMARICRDIVEEIKSAISIVRSARQTVKNSRRRRKA